SKGGYIARIRKPRSISISNRCPIARSPGRRVPCDNDQQINFVLGQNGALSGGYERGGLAWRSSLRIRKRPAFTRQAQRIAIAIRRSGGSSPSGSDLKWRRLQNGFRA